MEKPDLSMFINENSGFDELYQFEKRMRQVIWLVGVGLPHPYNWIYRNIF